MAGHMGLWGHIFVLYFGFLLVRGKTHPHALRSEMKSFSLPVSNLIDCLSNLQFKSEAYILQVMVQFEEICAIVWAMFAQNCINHLWSWRVAIWTMFRTLTVPIYLFLDRDINEAKEACTLFLILMCLYGPWKMMHSLRKLRYWS